MVRKSYNSGSYVAYTYNAEGSLARLSYGDSTGELASYRFEYDSLGRLIRSAELDADGGTVQRTEHIYDGYNRLSRQSWTLDGKTYSESYVYDDPTANDGSGDGALKQMTTAAGATIDYQYDGLRRLARSEVSSGSTTLFSTAYAFRSIDSSRTTSQVQFRNVRIGKDGAILEGKRYTYDALGNITRISQSTSPFNPLIDYEYDAQNQLTKETYYDGNGTGSANVIRSYAYAYDTAGNILSETKTENGQTTTKTYEYGNSDWSDLLTGVNGEEIRYDEIGNPETYDIDGTKYVLSWTQGRRLESIKYADGAKFGTSFTYDADGVRTGKKTDLGNSCTYLTLNGKVAREVNTTAKRLRRTLDFVYDESGRPFALNYKLNAMAVKTYYYVLNLQGDVVKLVSADGTEAASYVYDAWGNVLSATGPMADINPLRYRGYYYDVETGFYYLQSRYYDPATRRFINADVYSSTDSSDAVSCNMFAYCNNNPVNDRDDDGQLSWLAKIAIGVAAIAVGVGVTALTGGAALPALVAGVKAACVAGAISAGTSAATTALHSAASGDSFSTVVQKSAKAAVDGFADGFMAGGIAAGASQVASGGFKIAAKLGAKTGRRGGIKLGNTKILSPDAAWQKNNGGTLLKVGKTFRIDVGSNTLLHMHIPKVSSHIQIGTIGAGIYGGLK